MDASEFVLKCRGPLDHNLNQLPNYEEFFASQEPATNPAPKFELIDGERDGRLMDSDQKRKFTAALKDYRAGLYKSKRAACVAHKCDAAYQTFVNWSKKPAQQNLHLRPFILKPGGKLL